MTLIQFLTFWTHFVASHQCQTFLPDSAGLGNHVFYGGNCTEGFAVAQHLHGIVAWMGSSQGLMHF